MRKQYLLAVFFVGLLLAPTLLHAAKGIALDSAEKQRLAQGETIVREVEGAGKAGKTFEAIGLIKASRTEIMQVLTDYEKYPEFMPNVSRVEIVSRRGKEAVLNYTLALPMGITRKYRLKISASPPGSQSAAVAWEMLPWPELQGKDTILATTGYWRIEEKDEKNSLVLYHVYTDPGPIPLGLGWIVDALSKDSVPDVLLQTKNRAEKISPPQAVNLKPPAHK